MLRIVRALLAGAIVAIMLASPVAADRHRDDKLDEKLIQLSGRVIKLDKLDEFSWIRLEARNVNEKGEPQPGRNTVWTISADTDLLKAAGLTRAVLNEGTKITVSGYRVDGDVCKNHCWFAGRQVTLENRCVSFIGREPAAFGQRSMTWGTNIPEDGLENPERSHC